MAPKRKGNSSLMGLWDTYTAMLTSGDADATNARVYDTGLVALDALLGADRGITGGSVLQLLGEAGHGKTTLALHMLARAQQTGQLAEIAAPDGRTYNAAIIDFERSYDSHYAATLGVDTAKLLVVRSAGAEDALLAERGCAIAEALLSQGMEFILIDSIGGLVTMDDSEKDYSENAKMADEARILTRFIKRATQLMTANALVILINQYRANMSPMARTTKTPYGARAIQYFSKVTLELTRIATEDGRKKIQAFISKNKTGGKESHKIIFDIIQGQGIDYNGHILELALELDIVRRRGAWYNYGELTAQGSISAVERFPMDEVRGKVIEQLAAQEQ